MSRADQRKFHYIYRIVREDSKYYIGMHSTDDLDDGYFGSGQLLWKSINAHGKEKHTKEILEFCSSRSELKQREKEIVNIEMLGDAKCMNLRLGGEGGWDHINEEMIKRRSTTFKEKGRGRCKRDGTNVAIAMTGNTNFASSSRFTGLVPTEEHRRKIGEKNKQLTGERNSQFGTCWITDGVKPIKIQKEELDRYLVLGYRRGRK